MISGGRAKAVWEAHRTMSGKRQPRFDVEVLRELAGDKAFARGQAYYKDGLVEIVRLEPGRVLARVSGTEDYRSELTGRAANIDGECSCRAFEDRGFCKHLVAVGLAANDADEGADDALARIRRHLGSMDVAPLVDIIVRQAERDMALLRDLDLSAALAVADDATLEARFRQAVDDATEKGGSIDYRGVGAWAEEVRETLDRIAGVLDAGRAALALRLIEYALPRIAEAVAVIDDSDGEGGGLLVRARDIHLAACRAAPPDPVKLARTLFERELEDNYDTFHRSVAAYAEMLGERGIAEFRRRVTAAWKKLPRLAGGPRARNEVSADHSRLADMLDYFAERDGDIEARIAIRAHDLSAPYRYHELARFCLDHGREAEALRWAEEGLWLFEDDPPDEQLIGLAVELFARAGRAADAVALLWRAFERRPSLSLHRQLRRIAGDEATARAVAFLRSQPAAQRPTNAWHSPADLLISILMEESRFAEAWEAVRLHGASDRLKEALAMASEAAHPGEALAVYAARVDLLVTLGGNDNYEEACRLIARMAGLREPALQAAYVGDLNARFKAKRNFVKLLGAPATRDASVHGAR